MDLALVIPTHNRRDLLRRCLDAATDQSYPDYEVIVVDDGSTDGTWEMLRAEFPGVRCIHQEPSRGPAAARNRGIEATSAAVVAFTDDDCVLPADFLSSLAAGYRHYPQAAGVGGYLLPPEELLVRNAFARYEAYVTRRIYHAGSEPYLGGYECPAGGTNSMSYRRDVLRAVGAFDETFPVAGGEDADLKRRIVDEGGRILYVPVGVTHVQSYDLSRFLRQQRTHGRGAVHFERKHCGGPPRYRRLALRAGARMARWLPDLVRLGFTLATIKLMGQFADLAGQWQEVRWLNRPDRNASQ